jgi:hypothetical protein
VKSDPVPVVDLQTQVEGRLRASQPAGEDRRGPRRDVIRIATLRLGDLTVPVTLRNVAAGGAFVTSMLVVEPGERCELSLPDGPAVVCRVAWVRPFAHPDGPGCGLVFVAEEESLRWVLAALDA